MEPKEVRDVLSRMTHPAHTGVVRVEALAALYIGDGLREIAQAINGAANPTDADLDKVDRTGECWPCRHWTRHTIIGGGWRPGYCDLPTSATNMAGVAGKCTGFVERDE